MHVATTIFYYYFHVKTKNLLEPKLTVTLVKSTIIFLLLYINFFYSAVKFKFCELGFLICMTIFRFVYRILSHIMLHILSINS